MSDHLANLERDLSTLIVEYAGSDDTQQPDAGAFGRVYVEQADLRALIAEVRALREVAQAASDYEKLLHRALIAAILRSLGSDALVSEEELLHRVLIAAGYDPEQKEVKHD